MSSESLQGDTSHEINVLAGRIGNKLTKQRQRERIGDLDVFGCEKREICHAEAFGVIIVGKPGHQASLGLPAASNQAEGCHHLEIGTPGALAVVLPIVVAGEEGLPRDAQGAKVVAYKTLDGMASGVFLEVEVA